MHHCNTDCAPETPLVSVVIPCFNQAMFLGLALESVLNQTYRFLEIIIVNDGSDDNTAEVAEKYLRPNVSYFWQSNKGPASARNTGIAHSHGQFITFLDADDLFRPEALETGVRQLLAFPDCAFVYGHHRFINADGSVLKEFKQQSFEGRYYESLLHHNFIGMHGTVLYRRAILVQVGGFNPDPEVKGCEDYELYLRITRQFPICSHDTIVAEYRQHGTNLTRNKSHMLKAALRVLNSQAAFVSENDQYRSAYEGGQSFWRDYYHERIFRELNTSGLEQLLADGSTGLFTVTSPCVELFYEFRLYSATEHHLLLTTLSLVRDSDGGWRPIEEKSGTSNHASIKATITQEGFNIDWNTGDGSMGQIYCVSKRDIPPVASAACELKQPTLVSIIIPCFNQSHFLKDAIKSVLAQTHRTFEIIVVDDGSTDATAAVSALYPHVRCVRQENQGLASARNTGLASSRGEYLVFLDADDRLLPDALQIGLECLQERPRAAFAYGHYSWISADGENRGPGTPPYEGIDHYEAFLRVNFVGTPAAVMFRRYAFEVIGGFDIRVSPAADYDVYLRVAKEFQIFGHGKLVAEYRRHDQNMSRNSTLMLRSVLTVLRSQEQHLSNAPRYQGALATGVNCWCSYYGGQLDHRDALLLVNVTGEELISEKLFARSASGSRTADWINAGAIYEFSLFSGSDHQQMLASLRVTRENSLAAVPHLDQPWPQDGTPFVTASPNPVPAGPGVGATTISWDTGDGRSGEVYVRVLAPRRRASLHQHHAALGIAGTASQTVSPREGPCCNIP
jgi:glycosyltransferase involved in cell wall biosynthesis